MMFFKSVKIVVVLITAFVAATLLHSQPASAEVLDGAAFKKLVIGNTLHYKFWSNRSGREYEFMYYFINEKKILFSSAGSSDTAEEDWSVTDEGKFCRVSARTDRKRCTQDFQVKGDKLIAKTRKGRDRVFILLKGKHEF